MVFPPTLSYSREYSMVHLEFAAEEDLAGYLLDLAADILAGDFSDIRQ